MQRAFQVQFVYGTDELIVIRLVEDHILTRRPISILLEA